MATRVPLPHPRELPDLVLFHRDDPAEPTVVLQVPNTDRTDSETYVVDLDHSDHAVWFDLLPHSRALRDLLTMAQHVAYCPRSGHTSEIADLDTPSLAAVALAEARQGAVGSSPVFERFFAQRQTMVPGVSNLRRSLGSKLR
jgi:hypothetical protein